MSDWWNRISPMGCRSADTTCRKAGQGPGGQGGGRKRRPSSNRRDRATRRGGDTQPERVLTSHRSSRKRRQKGDGKPGPNGRAASGTERPRLSMHGLVPERWDHRGMESPKPALSDLPSGLRYRGTQRSRLLSCVVRPAGVRMKVCALAYPSRRSSATVKGRTTSRKEKP